MTAQILDIFIFRGCEFVLVGFAGGHLVEPEDFGMEPDTPYTACWRGFYATYEIIDGEIFLKEMMLREKNGNYKPINHLMPRRGWY